MRKAILMMLIVVSNSAMAEWVKFSSVGNQTNYVNLDTIHKSGNKVKMWSLFDYKTAREVTGVPTYMSVQMQDEYDCKEELSRPLYAVLRSGNMGEGKPVVTVTDSGKWEPHPPESIREDLWKIACGKRNESGSNFK